MRNLWILLIGFSSSAFAADGDVSARPKYRPAPEYPVSCAVGDHEEDQSQYVTLTFSVDRHGETRNVQVRESTDPCFNEVSIAAVRRWSYEPRYIGKKAVEQEDLEVTLKFQLALETEAQDYDARPIVREPPKYPASCMRRAEPIETVLVQFNVTENGLTDSIKVLESTNSCLNKAATAAVSEWRYRPKIIDGETVARSQVETMITFQLSSGGLPESEKLRRRVHLRLLSVQRMIDRKKDSKEILLALEQLEEEYGDGFTTAELSAFHQLRGVARLEAKDFQGALDDFRIFQKMGRAGEASSAIGQVIIDLENALGLAVGDGSQATQK